MKFIGSQREVLMNFNIPRNLDSLPNSLREELPAKETDATEWHSANFPKIQVNSVKKKAECCLSYINTQLQVPTYAGPKGTSTPAGLVSSTKNHLGEVKQKNKKG